MKNILLTIKNDFAEYKKYHFITILTIISFLFSLLMGVTNLFPPIIYIYISIFILPVITFSVTLFIESQQRTVLPQIVDSQSHPSVFAVGKILSATLLQLIPLIFYIIVMVFVLDYSFNIPIFALIYLLASITHIVIGLTLSIIAKSQYALSISYLVYLIVFTIIPIYYSLGIIQSKLNYLLIISPAFLSGILFESLINNSPMMPDWVNYLAVVLQFIYIGILFIFVIKPFIFDYLKLNYDLDVINENKKESSN